MTDNQSETMPQGRLGKAFFKTYWFWGLVFISFLLHFSEATNFGVISRWTEHDVSFVTFMKFTHIGTLVAGLLSVYFLRLRLKETLVIYTSVYLFSLILMQLGPTTQSVIYLAAVFFKNIGYFGILLTIVAVLITAKLHLKSFLIAIMIIWFWKIIGEALGGIYSFEHRHLENQIHDFYYSSSEADIKPSAQDLFFYYLTCLLPATLAVIAATRLNSKKFFGQFIPKTSIKPALPLNAESSGWLWQDLVSSYRFWGLVLISFSITLTKNAVLPFGESYREFFFDEYGRGLYTCITYAPIFIAGLLTVYFVKGRIKLPLIGFSLLFLISLSLECLGPGPFSYMGVITLKNVGYYGVLLTVLSALVTARLPLKSFFIAFFIVWFWFYLGETLGFASKYIDRSYTPIDDKGTAPASYVFFTHIAPLLPAAFAILAALKLKPEMFFRPPDIRVEAKPATVRDPFEVFVCALIVPFYVLYWLFKQPGELKTLAPDMHQPSPRGALCLALFAPLILPMWFYDVRKGLTPRLKDRSAKRIAVASFFSPAIAAAMAQSDYNQITKKEADSS
ncbi:MAG: hypothetical protein ABJ275_10300 [Maricaulaceae bacterium]